MTTGIDVSTHNGRIDWHKFKSQISFAMIRGGYSLTIDARAKENIKACRLNAIPYGIYWFSYASTKAEAKAEAEAAINLLKETNSANVPVAFDFEYDSDRYLNSKGIYLKANEKCDLFRAFNSVITEHGCRCLIYTNVDYYSRFFKDVCNKTNLWLAQWNHMQPSISCVMHQLYDDKTFTEITGTYDYNVLYDTTLFEGGGIPVIQKEGYEEVVKGVIDWYTDVARDVMNGKYGNGDERKQKLKEAGYDYVIVQTVVNKMIEHLYNIDN